MGANSIPWAIEEDTRAYLETVTRLATRLDIETIIPSHVLTTNGAEIGSCLRYLGQHIHAVNEAVRVGKSLQGTLFSLPLDKSYLPPKDSPLSRVCPLKEGFDKWNVKQIDQEPKKQ